MDAPLRKEQARMPALFLFTVLFEIFIKLTVKSFSLEIFTEHKMQSVKYSHYIISRKSRISKHL